MESDLRACQRLLPAVSRTFALTIRVLPRPLRHPVTTAYLLCRLADTVEDATREDPAARIAMLQGLRRALAPAACDARAVAGSLAAAEEFELADSASARLIRERTCVARALEHLAPAQREVIAHWVGEMCAGMSTYVARELGRPAASPQAVSFGAAVDGTAPESVVVRFVLGTVEELRAYAWCVAGTVGHLLTELFIQHLDPPPEDRRRLRELATPFGLGLQFTNILQDLAEDRRRGWSYVPEELARRCGTSVRSLDQPQQVRAGLHVVGELVRETASYLDLAMEYILLLPRRAPRVRLFCLWPTFFAVRTLVRIWGEERVLTGAEKIRITRDEVRRVIRSTAASCLWNRSLARLYNKERERLLRRIEVSPV